MFCRQSGLLQLGNALCSLVKKYGSLIYRLRHFFFVFQKGFSKIGYASASGGKHLAEIRITASKEEFDDVFVAPEGAFGPEYFYTHLTRTLDKVKDYFMRQGDEEFEKHRHVLTDEEKEMYATIMNKKSPLGGAFICQIHMEVSKEDFDSMHLTTAYAFAPGYSYADLLKVIDKTKNYFADIAQKRKEQYDRLGDEEKKIPYNYDYFFLH